MKSVHEIYSRRHIMGWAFAAGAAAVLPTQAFAARKPHAEAVDAAPYVAGQSSFSSVTVDTSGMADRGLPNYAARIAKEAEPLVTKIFADRLSSGRSGARLIIKVDIIDLRSEESTNAGFFGTSSQDSISGAGVVVDAHGRELFRKPIDTSIPSMHSPGDLLYVENLRAMNLVETLARWVKQDV